MKSKSIALKLLSIVAGATMPLAFPLLTSCKKIEFKQPILRINGDISTISKTNEVPVSISFSNLQGLGGALPNTFSCDAKIKLQGAGSVIKNIPKKNFSAKLYERGTEKKYKVVMKENWNKINKFVWKSNYRDNLSCHNIGASQLWGDIVHQSKYIAELDKLPFGGGIDGFPIVTYLNNKFWGLYTWNLKKSENLYGMEEGDVKQAILNVDKKDEILHSSWLFKKTITDLGEDCWEIDFCSTGDDHNEWVVPSFNCLISGVIGANNRESFIEIINKYSNLNHLIDYYVYLSVSASWDNIANNSVWVTYDGEKWYPSFYDGDYSFGFHYTHMLKPNFDFDNFSSINLLFNKLVKYCSNEISAEYKKLRQDSLSNNNILNRFKQVMDEVDFNLLAADYARWGIRYASFNNWKSLKKFVSARTEWLDEYYK